MTKEWLEECQRLQQKLPWKQFKCGKYRDKVQDTAEQQGSDQHDSEEEDMVDDDSEYDPGEDKREDSDGDRDRRVQRQRSKEDLPSASSLPEDCQIEELNVIFRDKRFYLKRDIDDPDERRTLTRYIVGHGGELSSDPESAEYVISWGPGARSPLWVVKCHQQNRMVEE